MRVRCIAGSLALIGIALASTAAAQTVREVYRRVNQTVVVVYTAQRGLPAGQSGQLAMMGGLGSGVLIAPDKILTAAHVVQAADTLLVEFASGKRVSGRVLSSEPAADVAIIQLATPVSDVTPATLGDSDLTEVGDEVLVIGAPFGVTHTLTVGHISARRQPNKAMGTLFAAELLQTDAAINTGNSGGPMFNMNGEVIGVVSYIISRSGGFEGLGFVVTSNLARELVIEGKPVWSGVSTLRLNEELGAILNVPPPGHGALVQQVARGSLGERLALRVGTVRATIGGSEVILGGDIVLSVQGISVDQDNYERLRAVFDRLRPGDPIRVQVLRGGRVIELTATL